MNACDTCLKQEQDVLDSFSQSEAVTLLLFSALLSGLPAAQIQEEDPSR